MSQSKDEDQLPDIDLMPDEDLPTLEELPGDLRLLAEEIGLRPALRVARRVGGTGLYIPSLKPWWRKFRNRHMRQRYDRGGITVKELARRNMVCERTAYNILGIAEPDERQIRMF